MKSIYVLATVVVLSLVGCEKPATVKVSVDLGPERQTAFLAPVSKTTEQDLKAPDFMTISAGEVTLAEGLYVYRLNKDGRDMGVITVKEGARLSL